jgi:hypothetical protein
MNSDEFYKEMVRELDRGDEEVSDVSQANC